MTKANKTLLPVDAWKDERYDDTKKVRPFAQWNASKFENKVILIQDEYAQMVDWQITEHSTWELGECMFENSGEIKEVWQTNEPIILFIGVAEKFTIAYQPYGSYQKGDRVPETEPYDPNLHRTWKTYLVAFLDYNPHNQSYSLLHKQPFRFTPKSSSAGEFENLYNWWRKTLDQVYGKKCPSFLIPLHLGGTRKVAESKGKNLSKRINVPIVLKPQCPTSPNANLGKAQQNSSQANLKTQLDKLFDELGDDIRIQAREWYNEYIALKSASPSTTVGNIDSPENDDSNDLF